MNAPIGGHDVGPNEAVIEDEIILKVLSSLGWADSYLRQQTATQNRREDVPDMLLFADVAHKQKALREKKDDKRYPHGIAILDSKRWLRALDRGDATDPLDRGTPSNQILRYLSAAEIASNRQIRFGRLVIILELIERERLAQPLLYLSAFNEANRQDYYDLLQRIRTHIDWPAWIRYFLTGVEQTAKQAIAQAKSMLDLREKLRAQLVDKPRAQLLIDELFKNPYVTVARAATLGGE